MSEAIEIPHGLEIAPEARARALASCREQLARWCVTPPPSEPLVIDFGLERFEEYGLYEFWIANEVDAGYCGKYMYVDAGQECPLHKHRVKHETFFVVRGQLDVTLRERSFVLEEGQTLAIQPGALHSFKGKGGPALMLELSMPCDPIDNYFESPVTMEWLRSVVGDAETAPLRT